MMVVHGYKFHHRHSPRMMLLLVVVALLATSISAFNLGSRRLSYRPTLATHAVDCAQGQFDSLVVTASSTQPVIVDFYADWCGPCKLVAPIFKQLSEELPALKFVKVDVDVHESLAERYSIQGLPLFGMFRDGQLVASHSGALSKDKLREFIEKNSK